MSRRAVRLLVVAALGLLLAAVAVWADVVSQGLLTRLDPLAKAAGEAARSPGLTPLVQLVTDLGATPARSVVALAVVVPLALRWRSWRPVVLGVLAVGLAPAVSASTKRLVDRPRPPAAEAIEAPLDPSFPSGHATASACLATALAALAVLALRVAWARLLAVAAAAVFTLLVGLTRVYLGAHWVTDVLAGWCTGAALALLLVALVRPGPRARASTGLDAAPSVKHS